MEVDRKKVVNLTESTCEGFVETRTVMRVVPDPLHPMASSKYLADPHGACWSRQNIPTASQLRTGMKQSFPSLPGVLALVSLMGVVFFLVTSAAPQWLRTDLDILRKENSFYLVGPYGGMVRAGYFALATALVTLGTGWYVTLTRSARSGAPLLLFAMGAVGLIVTALARTDPTPLPETREGFIHGLAATTAFLCGIVAMVMQAWRLRYDIPSRRYFPIAVWSAMACFAGMWLQIVPMPVPAGIKQKVLILAVAMWLIGAAILLFRRSQTAKRT